MRYGSSAWMLRPVEHARPVAKQIAARRRGRYSPLRALQRAAQLLGVPAEQLADLQSLVQPRQRARARLVRRRAGHGDVRGERALERRAERLDVVAAPRARRRHGVAGEAVAEVRPEVLLGGLVRGRAASTCNPRRRACSPARRGTRTARPRTPRKLPRRRASSASPRLRTNALLRPTGALLRRSSTRASPSRSDPRRRRPFS